MLIMLKQLLFLQIICKCLTYIISVNNELLTDDSSKNIYKDLNTAFKSFSSCEYFFLENIEIYLYGNSKVYTLYDPHFLCSRKVKLLSGSSVISELSFEQKGKIQMGNGSEFMMTNIIMKMSNFKTRSSCIESSGEFFPSSFILSNVQISDKFGEDIGSIVNLNNVQNIFIQNASFINLTITKTDSLSTLSFFTIFNCSNITISNLKMITNKMDGFNLLSALSSNVFLTNATFKSNEFSNFRKLGLIAVSDRLQIKNISFELNTLENVTIFTSLSKMKELKIMFSNFTNNVFLLDGSSLANLDLSLQLSVSNCYFSENYVAGFFVTVQGSEYLEAEILRNYYQNNTCFRIFTLTEARKLSIIDSIAKNQNRNDGILQINILNLGALLFLDSVEEIIVSKLTIEDCRSTREAGGLIITTSLGRVTRSVLISESKFIENIMSSSEISILYPGFALYCSSASSVEIENSLFKDNTAHQPDLALGGPCLFIDYKKCSIFIRNCSFDANKAFESSNVFEFFGNMVNISLSNFQNNVNKLINYTNYGVGVLNFKGNYLTILKSNFTSNLGSAGVFFLSDFKVFSCIWFFDVNFIENKASYGTLFNMDSWAKNRSVYCENCFIKKNLGESYGMLYIYSVDIVLVHNITFVNSQFIENESLGATIAAIWIYSSSNTYNNYYNVTFIRNIAKEMWGLSLFSFYTLETWIFLTVRDCLFEGNTAVAATIYILFYTNFTDIGSLYINNYASDTTSILYALYQVQAKMENIHVEGSYANYGVFLFANDEANIFLSNVTLHRLKTKFNIFAVASFVSLHLENLIIKEPVMPPSGCLFEFKNNGDFLEKIINLTVINPPAIAIIFSEKTKIVIVNLVYPSSNQALFKLRFSEMNMRNGNFTGSNCNTSKGCFLEALDSTLFIEYLKMSNSTCSSCVGFLYLERTDFSLSKSNIFEIKNPKGVAIIYAKASNLIKISDTLFSSNSNAVFYGIESALNIFDSNFSAAGLEAEELSIITCEDCNGVNTTNSIFTNAKSKIGAGAITLRRQNKDTLTLIRDSSFKHLKGEYGGAIYSEQVQLKIINCKFIKNVANQGGALYFFCSGTNDEDCGLEYYDNTFKHNQAEFDGGAVKWLYKPPIERKNEFENNTSITGNKISNYPVRFRFRIFRHESDESLEAKFQNMTNINLTFFKWKKTRERVMLYDSFSNYSFYYLQDQPSSQSSLVDFQFSLVDSYDQEIQHDIKANIECSMLTNFSFFSKEKAFNEEALKVNETYYYDKNEAKISGTLSVYQDFDDKRMMFENIYFNTHPGRIIYLNFSSSKIVPMNNQIFNSFSTRHPNEIIDDERKSYYITIPVIVAGCKLGELYNTNTGSCYRCPANSFTFSILEESCLSCPLNAECLGGADIKVALGYWRSDYLSLNIYKCNKMLDNCLGGIYSECAPNMGGILCGKCIYSSEKNAGLLLHKSFDGKCVECLDKPLLVLLYFFFWIFFSLLLYMITYFITKSESDEEPRVLFRIWLNYFQIGILMQSYNINIGLFMKEFDVGQKIISIVARVWFSIECFVQTSNNNNNYHIQSVVVSVVMYFAGILLFIMIKFRNRGESKTYYIKERIILCFYILQPFYMDFLSNNLSCIEIDGKMRIRNMPDEICYTNNYYLWFFLFYMPNLIFWGVGLTYLIVREARFSKLAKIISHSTDKPVKNNERIMFLRAGFKKSHKDYIWEIVNWVIKLLIIIFNQVEINEQSRYYIIFFLICHYILYQTIYNPYQKRIHNWLEKLAKYSLIFIALTLLMMSFDMDIRLYNFSMSISLIVQFLFTVVTLMLAFQKKLLKISWIKKFFVKS